MKAREVPFGAAYAASFLAPLLLVPSVAGLADRYPARADSHLLRAPGAVRGRDGHIPRVPVLSMAVALIQVPFKGAQGALVRQALADHLVETCGVALDDAARNVLNGPDRVRLLMIREVAQLADPGGVLTMADSTASRLESVPDPAPPAACWRRIGIQGGGAGRDCQAVGRQV